MPEAIESIVERALQAYAGLIELGESIEDEWSYVDALGGAWQGRLAVVIEQRGAEATPPAVSAAVDGAIAEIELIVDPHRAIDWLSTFPQVVLLALGEAP